MKRVTKKTRSSGPRVVVRAYRNADRRAVVAAMRTNVPEFFDPSEMPWLHRYLRQKGNRNFVVCVDGRVVGFGGYALNAYANRAELCWGQMARDWQGRGLGRVLLLHRLADLARRSPETGYLALNTIPAVAGFFERHGFERYGEWARGYRSGLDMVEMMRRSRGSDAAGLERAAARAIKRVEQALAGPS